MPFPIALIVSGAAFLTGCLLINNKKKSVFISYYSREDSHFKNLIIAWAKNEKFELNFEDVSTDVAINSTDVSYMKRRMRERIDKADYFLVFVGENTHDREWVYWEIEQAKSLNKKIIAVKEKKSHKSPKSLLGCGAVWVNGFSEEGIRKALK